MLLDQLRIRVTTSGTGKMMIIIYILDLSWLWHELKSCGRVRLVRHRHDHHWHLNFICWNVLVVMLTNLRINGNGFLWLLVTQRLTYEGLCTAVPFLKIKIWLHFSGLVVLKTAKGNVCILVYLVSRLVMCLCLKCHLMLLNAM